MQKRGGCSTGGLENRDSSVPDQSLLMMPLWKNLESQTQERVEFCVSKSLLITPPYVHCGNQMKERVDAYLVKIIVDLASIDAF